MQNYKKSAFRPQFLGQKATMRIPEGHPVSARQISGQFSYASFRAQKNDDFWNDKHGSKHATNAHATDIKIIATICMNVLYQTKKWWHLYHYVRQIC